MSSPGGILLSHVPEDGRPALLSALIGALRTDDGPSIDFVASAVTETKDEQTQRRFFDFLRGAIEGGHHQAAIACATKHPDIGCSLFAQCAEALSQAKSKGEPEDSYVSNAAVVSYLRFCQPTFSHASNEGAQIAVLSASIGLLTSADEATCHAARDMIFAALSSSNPEVLERVVRPLSQAVWTQIQTLARENQDKRAQVLGYSLWLRWILATDNAGLEGLMDDSYWDLLLNGLRRGDSEIRKMCLNILKLSMVMEESKVTADTRAQFERYATVFETIVLGRYINQIQECESDLDELISDRSLVGSKWLYTLLASGLDSQMQDSNRKFIGGWVMRARLRTGDELPRFLQHDFLPWATQGSLFVASLKRNELGDATCPHGESLSDHMSTSLQQEGAAGEVRKTVWSYVCNKKTFAYAKVWLLKALAEADKGSNQTKLYGSFPQNAVVTEGSGEQIMRGLPEAARDYVSRTLAGLSVPVESEQRASRRDVLEGEAIAKCSNVVDAQSLDDLWSDLDCLEFPKSLLFKIPSAILSPRLLDRALADSDLVGNLREKVATLQKVAETKTYLISPLNIALRSAILHNPKAFDLLQMNEYILRAVDNPPEPTIDLMLEEATVNLFGKYEDYFGEQPSFGIAALLDLVSRIRDQGHIEQLIDRLLHRWKTQKTPPPTVSAWKTTPQLQTLLLCLENFNPTQSQARQLVSDLLRILSIEPLPGYRYLLEWMIVRLMQRMRLEDVVLDQLASKDHHSNPKYLASLMKIGSIIGCSSESNEQFGSRLATLYVPLAASSKVVIRHEAQWQVPILLEHARSQGWATTTENPAMIALDDYIRSLERFHEPPLERKIGRFDPETHHTITNLVEGTWFGLDSTEAPLTSRNEFEKLYAQGMPTSTPESRMALGDPIPQHLSPAPATASEPSKPTPAPRTLDTVTALQTKGTAYLARTLSSPAASTTRPHNLIVVGSLVDNPYNLGGLSRVSEIFGASALTLQNQNVVGNKDFTSVSVSSHLHFPLVQLSAPGVPAWLAERKSEGWSVVGIEQTDRSVMLGSEAARLPAKCVLVVGSEREGIPAQVLTECEVLVEIPQVGVTRSLNVQTAVAVVLFEYARQHRGRR